MGRNNRQNDALSRSASDQDLWLHARGVPGSHVIVKVPPGSEPRAGDREYAANLAAFFSKVDASGQLSAPHPLLTFATPRNYAVLASAPGRMTALWGRFPISCARDCTSLAC